MKHEHIKQFEIETDAKRVLRRAREMVEAGWCQGWRAQFDFTRDIHNRCAIQAIQDAANELKLDDFEAEQLLTHACGTPYNVPLWQDAKGRKKEEVLAAFDKAITFT